MIKVISTSDGSSSLFVENLNETYHSRHGALQESRFVFIQEGLEHLKEKKTIQVLEVGMGTGLNVLLSLEYALQRKVEIHMISLEPFPIPEDLLEEINYAELLDAPEQYKKIHSSPWDKKIQLNDYFSFTKLKSKAEEFQSNEKFDIIFYDAFGPHAQPELWEQSVFEQLNPLLKDSGTLITYCAQGQFKRNLKAAGFTIERLPGPPGKREITRGTKI